MLELWRKSFRTKTAEKEIDKNGKINVLNCFENRDSEYFQSDENLELDDENDNIPDLESVSNDDDMPDRIDHAEEAFHNNQILDSNIYNEIRISDLIGVFIQSNISYDCLNFKIFRDNSNLFTMDMDIKDKILMVFHRDCHSKKLYLNLRR